MKPGSDWGPPSADFQELFSAAAVDMLQNRRARWADYLNAASLGVV